MTRYLFVSDIHGRSLDLLERVAAENTPDGIVVLGDYDYVETLRDVREFSERTGAVVLPGNHDHSLYAGIGVESDTLEKQDADWKRLQKELGESPEQNYLQRLLANPTHTFTIEGKTQSLNALAMHAALDGSLHSYPDASAEAAPFWYRLKTSEEWHRKNFSAMRERGIDILFRGHDAQPQLAYRTEDGRVTFYESESAFRIKPGRQHTVTVGDYYSGHYCVLETDLRGYDDPIVFLYKDRT